MFICWHVTTPPALCPMRTRVAAEPFEWASLWVERGFVGRVLACAVHSPVRSELDFKQAGRVLDKHQEFSVCWSKFQAFCYENGLGEKEETWSRQDGWRGDGWQTNLSWQGGAGLQQGSCRRQLHFRDSSAVENSGRWVWSSNSWTEERQTTQHTHSDSQTHIWDVLQCDTWTHRDVCDVWTRDPVAAPSLTLLRRTPSATQGTTTWQPRVFIAIFSEFNLWKYSIRSDRSDFSGGSRISQGGGVNTKGIILAILSQKLHEILKKLDPAFPRIRQ